MRYNDLIGYTIIDMLAVMTAEGTTSISLETIQQTLASNNMDVDTQTLTQLLDNIPIVNTIKDNVVFFNKNDVPGEDNPEKDDNKVSALAKKQIDKEMSK
jgi:hypothetical protein